MAYMFMAYTGRVSGKEGRTKFAIENATRTRIVLADQKIHIMYADPDEACRAG